MNSFQIDTEEYVFWVVAPYSWERAKRFSETYHLHLQGQRVSQARNHVIKTQKTTLFIVTAVRTSNPTRQTLTWSLMVDRNVRLSRM
jgi:hypothetical protein